MGGRRRRDPPGLGFALYLSPFGGLADVIVGVYLGAIPATAAFFAGLSEFDLFGAVGAWIRWRRADGRYVPGGGSAALGYAVLASDTRRAGRQREPARAGTRGAVGLGA